MAPSDRVQKCLLLLEESAASAAGVFYGAQTLKQLIRTDGAEPQVYTATIRDWPAMRWRGMQDDLSRGPLPTLEFQKRLDDSDPFVRAMLRSLTSKLRKASGRQ